MSNEEKNIDDVENVEGNEEVKDVEVEITEDPSELLEDARNKADEYRDQFLRSQAEMENLRRRQSRDLENAHKRALDKFVGELLPIHDSMELGLNAAKADTASIEAVREGLEMTIKIFLSSINKFGLEEVNPAEGDDFNPELHQAIAMQPAEGVETNKILNVAQKGFQFNGRLLRPAMVLVSQ